jgi:hypothetical protein
MEKQYTAESLRDEIHALEIRQSEEGRLVKEQLLISYENLKPINILKSIVKDVYSSDNYTQDFMEIVAGMTSGFVTKKLIIGRSENPLLKLIGLAVQFGMTTLVAKKFNAIKDSAMNFLNRVSIEKNKTQKNPSE